MIHNILNTIFLFSSLIGFSQEPVVWGTSFEKVSDTDYDLVYHATIADKWHMFSQYTPDGGSLPTVLTFEGAGTDFELLGKAEESETINEYSEVFEVEEVFFRKEATFTQRIRLLKPEVRQVNVEIFYQACIDVCINRTAMLGIALDGGAVIKEERLVDDRSEVLSQGLLLNLKNKDLLTRSANGQVEKNGLWGIFILGFLGGLIALLTPCVFPMIPLTVSFFTKHSQDRKRGVSRALLYGFFIVLIYFLLSLPFHLFDSVDPQILNNLSTNIWLNIFFFAVFISFAFSFFGYYELTLPSSWANKMDKASEIGGGIGVFFMALTLAIVSFSCTGPILGALLGSTTLAQGDVATNLSAGILGFGVALALPFAIFAMFPAWLNALPKSGGWMNTAKATLGFLELALAFKFLSKADLVAHWGLLKREVFIGIWIMIFLLMALYLLGRFRFKHEPRLRKIGRLRITTAILTIAFIIYLVPGLTNTQYANLKLISGFPPPLFYSIYPQKTDCPLGLDCFKDFEEGLVHAKAEEKPILIDFTGWGCENCRRMEENVWSTDEVFSLLDEEYVLISLYVDDRRQLAKEAQFNFRLNEKQVKSIRTIGDKWATFQTANFGTASQPYYILMSPGLELLHHPTQYTDEGTYEAWLEKGLENYQISNRLAPLASGD